jgi:sporulation protein YlmC with PRC-barrel domain
MKTKTSVFIGEVNAEMELFSAALKNYAHVEYERVQNMGDDINNDQE